MKDPYAAGTSHGRGESTWGARLIEWDELSTEELDALGEHPVYGPRLDRLRAAEAWLEHHQPAQASACPSAEELYDFGRGPGHARLEPARERALGGHVLECTGCSALLRTLESTPPAPLELETAPDPVPSEAAAPPAPAPRRAADRPALLRGPRARAAALAAAALLMLGTPLFLWSRHASRDVTFPSAPLLRGESGRALVSPRGPVLSGGPWLGEARFRLDPTLEADAYRVVVRARGADAFAEGTHYLSLQGPEPVLGAAAPLPPGHYTWEAWRQVGHLERHLGERDFRVVQDPALLERAQSLEGLERLRLLHEAGYHTDARSLARSLPPSPERDAYLRPPGR